jgi:benzoate-CoA ligase family protein
MTTTATIADQAGGRSGPAAVPAGVEIFNAASWLLDRNAEANPNRRALLSIGPGSDLQAHSYAELQTLVRRTAAALVAAGVRAEERLLLCMADTPELVATFLAGLHIGAVPVPVNTMLTGKDLGVLAADSRAGVFVVTAEFLDAAAVPASSPYLRDVVLVGGRLDADVPARVRDWNQFLAAGDADTDATAAVAAPYPTVADSPGFWLYTSGTTGTPKGAMHRHGSLRSTADTYARDVLGIRPDDVCFSVAKLFFAYGLGNSLTFPFSVGASTILDRARPTPADTAEILTRHRPSMFFGVPVMYAGLLAADVPRDAFASVRLCLSAGEAMPAELCRRFMDRFGVQLLDGIGSTEALHIFLSNRAGRVRAGTTGEPVAGYDLRLEDDEGTPVPDGEPGNLYVRGDSIATGYWSRTEITRRVFRGEWLRTGDTYVRDTDGYYTAMGRSDDVLKSGGIWVSPAEVEDRLLQHDAVSEAAVVSVPDEAGLAKPVACVVLRPGGIADADELIAFCREGLAAFKRPRHILVLDQMPRTATGKLQRFKVREFALARLAGKSGSA